jgi:hypothetical protein
MAAPNKADAKEDLKSLSMPELLARLASSPEGLSQAEAQKRLVQYGPNEIEEKKNNLFLKLLSYFWGLIPRLSSRPGPHSDAEVSEIVRGGPSHDLSYAHARPFLVHTTGAGIVACGSGHTDRGDADRGLWNLRDPSWLGLGPVRLGVCAGLVHGEQPRKISCLSDFRSREGPGSDGLDAAWWFD